MYNRNVTNECTQNHILLTITTTKDKDTQTHSYLIPHFKTGIYFHINNKPFTFISFRRTLWYGGEKKKNTEKHLPSTQFMKTKNTSHIHYSYSTHSTTHVQRQMSKPSSWTCKTSFSLHNLPIPTTLGSVYYEVRARRKCRVGTHAQFGQ